MAPIITDAILAEGKRTLAPRQRGALHAVEPARVPAPVVEAPLAPAPEEIARAMVARIEAERAQELSRERELALEQAKSEGHEQGTAAGYAEGLRQARDEVDAAAQAQRESFEALVASITDARNNAFERVVEDAVALAFAATCRILGEAFVTAEGVRAAVGHALRQAEADGEVVVRVARSDLDRLYGADPVGVDGRAVKLVADPSISMGGCVIETPAGALDARLETQILALRATLLEAHARDGTGRSPE